MESRQAGREVSEGAAGARRAASTRRPEWSSRRREDYCARNRRSDFRVHPRCTRRGCSTRRERSSRKLRFPMAPHEP